MRGFRLNGWQRIGIVLSVVWAFGALVYIWPGEEAFEPAQKQRFYNECIFDPKADTSLCEAKANAVHDARLRRAWNSLLWTLAPIPIAWLLIWGLIATVRWIGRGFQPSV